MSARDAKLLRDLWRMKAQATAIAAVIGLGVLMLVMQTGLVISLEESRRAYYDRYRFADIIAPVGRAPKRIEERIAALPGVSAVEGRVSGAALIDLPGRDVPLQALAVSLPDHGTPRVNAIHMTAGRMPAPGRSDEVVLKDSFAKAHGLGPGDWLPATMNGGRRLFQVVGQAQSPEFIYTTAPGELVPDDARFAVLWMGHAGLEAAFDMDGAVNEILLTLSREASEPEVIDAVDRILEPYGGTGAYGQADQFSNRFVSEEIAGLRTTTAVVPPIFLGIAAFLLYIVVSRMVQSEREEIGLMKAFGYTRLEVASHYMKFVLSIAAFGSLLGCVGGIAAGRALIGVYTQVYKFPFLVFLMDPAAFVTGTVVSMLAASAGGLFVLRRVFALAPAEAMRPPAPVDYSRSGQFTGRLEKVLDQPSRMVLRRLQHQPGRMAGAVIGIACGMGLSASMLTLYASFDETLDVTFSVVDRSDVTVNFIHAMNESAEFELARIPGVLRTEPVRHVSAILRNGRNTYRGAVSGLVPDAALNRAIDSDRKSIPMPADGIVLSRALAKKLNIKTGEMLTVDVREGRQPLLNLPVTRIADTLLGSPAYMRLSALNAAMEEPGRISGVYLTIDAMQARVIYRKLKDRPGVAGVSLKADALASFQYLLNTGAGMMRYILGVIAFTITFGIVYNAARIAHAERARDLASLRVLGFTRAETAFVLLGELGIVTLMALPLGSALGYLLSFGISAGFSTEFYQIPTSFDPASHGHAALVVLGAAAASGWLVKRDLDHTDLVAALKIRE